MDFDRRFSLPPPVDKSDFLSESNSSAVKTNGHVLMKPAPCRDKTEWREGERQGAEESDEEEVFDERAPRNG